MDTAAVDVHALQIDNECALLRQFEVYIVNGWGGGVCPCESVGFGSPVTFRKPHSL